MLWANSARVTRTVPTCRAVLLLQLLDEAQPTLNSQANRSVCILWMRLQFNKR